MSSTYLSLHYHIIFGTKHRAPAIAQEWRSRLHEYLGGTIAGLDGYPQAVGGVADHVHLLLGLKATHAVANVVREVKKASSAWLHQVMNVPSFQWQEGYAAFTVAPTLRDAVRRYIMNQEEHHRTRSFREELIDLLQRAGVNYDPQYFE